MDNEDRKYSLAELERYSYRTLQQISKSLFLPSNVKKMHLIQMIYAKKFKSDHELNIIIQKVKRERQQVSQGKKKVAGKRTYLQGTEISSTSNSLSPPISNTPKRPGHIVIRCSPENIRQAIAKYNARQSNLTCNSTGIRKTYPSPKKSDRILRSFNIKTTKNETKIIESPPKNSFKTNNLAKNSFGNINNSVLSVLRPQNEVSDTREQQLPMIVEKDSLVKKYKSVLNKNTFGLNPERKQLVPVIRNMGTTPMVPAKRQRVLSGIYPLVGTPKEPPKFSYYNVQSVGVRRQDGKISKINAIVQKRAETPKIEVTVQDIIDGNITKSFSNPGYVNTETNTSLTYSNINQQSEGYGTNVDQSMQRYDNLDNRNERCGNIDDRYEIYGNTDNENVRYGDLNQGNERYGGTNVDGDGDGYPYSVYYHKKIRGEQVRSQRGYQREAPKETEASLPKINDVFSRFCAHTDVTQPIYVQVSDESERFQNCPIYTALPPNTNLLEKVYNFRSSFIVNQPLPQVTTTASTRCIYTTPVIASAIAHPTALVPVHNAPSCERDNYYSDLAGFPRICELLKYGEQENLRRDFRCDEELSNSSLDDTASQDLGATVTIPEMVEDALELISQDGDYMERIGMDVRIQCVLCPFVCPRFLLEYHIRKEHSAEIHEQEHSTWSMSYSLGALLAGGARSVLAHDDALLVLSVLCLEDQLRAQAHSLETDTSLPKSGSITIYNKVSGEPYSWEGEIQTLPHDLDFKNNTDGLKVEVSKLDLLPNSANLKLSNGQLVLKSPNKVVMGQPDLNDIHVILFVKIFN